MVRWTAHSSLPSYFALIFHNSIVPAPLQRFWFLPAHVRSFVCASWGFSLSLSVFSGKEGGKQEGIEVASPLTLFLLPVLSLFHTHPPLTNSFYRKSREAARMSLLSCLFRVCVSLTDSLHQRGEERAEERSVSIFSLMLALSVFSATPLGRRRT